MCCVASTQIHQLQRLIVGRVPCLSACAWRLAWWQARCVSDCWATVAGCAALGWVFSWAGRASSAKVHLCPVLFFCSHFGGGVSPCLLATFLEPSGVCDVHSQSCMCCLPCSTLCVNTQPASPAWARFTILMSSGGLCALPSAWTTPYRSTGVSELTQHCLSDTTTTLIPYRASAGASHPGRGLRGSWCRV